MNFGFSVGLTIAGVVLLSFPLDASLPLVAHDICYIYLHTYTFLVGKMCILRVDPLVVVVDYQEGFMVGLRYD